MSFSVTRGLDWAYLVLATATAALAVAIVWRYRPTCREARQHRAGLAVLFTAFVTDFLRSAFLKRGLWSDLCTILFFVLIGIGFTFCCPWLRKVDRRLAADEIEAAHDKNN